MQVGVWIGIILLFAILYIVVSFIPILGGVATVVFGPVFSAGVAIGARSLDQGGELQVGHLFAGFRERFGTLIGVGAIYLAAIAAILLVVGAVTGASLFSLWGSGRTPGTLPPEAAMTLFIAPLVALALLLPAIMAVWFAPALVVFHDRGALESMKDSFYGCLKNIVPFLIYGLVTLVLGILATIPLVLGWLVFGPVVAASIYTAYKDIFTEA
jgi:uncharacterized membrane protein